LHIRQDIISNYSPLLSSSEKRRILNINTLPTVENLFFSISHNKSIGGYAACDQRIGFDIEEVSRLSSESVTRVCTPIELTACPDFKLLWSAKESAIKLFKTELVMSDIEILSWNQKDSFFLFEAVCHKTSKKIKGVVFISEQYTAACSFIL
jgi:4'-phosphopantetheinyl transferase EntD